MQTAIGAEYKAKYESVVSEQKDKIKLLQSKTAQMQKKHEKDERARIRIKEQVLEIYEDKNGQQYAEENDPNFTKIIVHIERVLKITTAQTLAIDSLERKIASLSKRKVQQYKDKDIIVPEQDEKIKSLIKNGVTDAYIKSNLAITDKNNTDNDADMLR